MSSRQRTPSRPVRSLAGLLLAVLALVSQLALGAIVLPDEAAAQEQSIAALDAISVLCQSPTPAAPDRAPAHHRCPDCALCPLSVALAMQATVLASGPDLPPPSSQSAIRLALPPPARAPPAQPHTTPLPRGPPVLI
jgi:hypothetical protein